jgi:hypothetical protein
MCRNKFYVTLEDGKHVDDVPVLRPGTLPGGAFGGRPLPDEDEEKEERTVAGEGEGKTDDDDDDDAPVKLKRATSPPADDDCLLANDDGDGNLLNRRDMSPTSPSPRPS